MKFSLCLPISIRYTDKKRHEMLDECLDSIEKQTYKNYEVIIKNTVENSRALVGEHIKVLYKPDKGIFDGLNQALEYATGDILHFICGDDLLGDEYTLDFIAEKFLRSDGFKPQWLYGKIGSIDEFGNHRPGDHGSNPATLQETLVHNRMGQPTVFWNRAMFEKVGYFGKYLMAADYDYWCRCYRTTPPMYVDRVLGIGRRWEESASHINKDIVVKEAEEISNRHTVSDSLGEIPTYVGYK